jgi:hypothetical protein
VATRQFQQGDWVVYRKQKSGTAPGPRAKVVGAAPQGETYLYFVDKFWVVKQLLDDDRALLITRTGKEHTVSLADPHLRRAAWWERWLYRSRFQATARLLSE